MCGFRTNESSQWVHLYFAYKQHRELLYPISHDPVRPALRTLAWKHFLFKNHPFAIGVGSCCISLQWAGSSISLRRENPYQESNGISSIENVKKFFWLWNSWWMLLRVDISIRQSTGQRDSIARKKDFRNVKFWRAIRLGFHLWQTNQEGRETAQLFRWEVFYFSYF